VELLYRERHEFYSRTEYRYHENRAGTYTHGAVLQCGLPKARSANRARCRRVLRPDHLRGPAAAAAAADSARRGDDRRFPTAPLGCADIRACGLWV
jgi:hypothetical protein